MIASFKCVIHIAKLDQDYQQVSVGIDTRAVKIFERLSDGARILSFGGPWEYGSYIYDRDGCDLTKITKPFVLDMGSSTYRNVYLEPEEARRVFTWAKPYMLKEE